MELSEAIKTTRQKAFMTQECFAQALCVTASTINRWEHGKAIPNLKALKKLKSLCDNNALDYGLVEDAWFRAHDKK